MCKDKEFTTAEAFNKKPKPIYRAADQGKEVVINHNGYDDKVFVLTARDRQPLEDKND